MISYLANGEALVSESIMDLFIIGEIYSGKGE